MDKDGGLRPMNMEATVVFTKQSDLSPQEAARLLLHYEPEKISYVPPVQPRVYGFGGLERWNGLDWNGMEWNGRMQLYNFCGRDRTLTLF